MSLHNTSGLSDDELINPSILLEPADGDVNGRSCLDGHSTKRQSQLNTDFLLKKDGTTEDEALEHPEDDNHAFFAKGRDFESVNVNHQYTKEERKILAGFESLDYLPSHSKAFLQWLKRQPFRLDWDRWIMMGIIGFVVGIVGFLNGQLIHIITTTKWEHGIDFISKGQWALGWTWITGYSVLFTFISTFIVVCLHPHAGGSGIPEVIGFLNGTIIHSIFSIRTLIAKFFSSVAAVGSGLPVGPEGPMIHMGALVGAGVSQARSESLNFELPFFGRFRNSEDRRNFISAGAGAGVASAFGAPVGGLLFAMEEVSSFWNMKLSWQTLFSCMTATFTTDLFRSAFTGFKYTGGFGLFKKEKYILFTIGNTGLEFHILVFLPTILLGVLGGLLGAAFTFLNLKMARVRRRLTSKLKQKPLIQKLAKMSEPILIMVVMATISVFLPMSFNDCLKFKCSAISQTEGEQRCFPTAIPDATLPPNAEKTDVEPPHETRQYNCLPVFSNISGDGAFSPGATLLMDNGHEAVKHLFSRKTHLEFGYRPLVAILVIYFLMACWAAGPSIAGGLVVPMLLIGGLYGRLVGRAMVDIFGIFLPSSAGGTEASQLWAWIDPGAFALIGAASFFGGVSRLTMSLTVIMIEITNDVMFLLPIMVAVMVAKIVADTVTHSLYHALLEVKCVPFLDSEPVIVHEQGNKVTNLELHSVAEVMSTPVEVVEGVESVSHLAHLLLSHRHGGFPVVATSKATGNKIFIGLITRLELTMVLMAEETFRKDKRATEMNDDDDNDVAPLGYQQVSVDKITDVATCQQKLSTYISDDKYQRLFVDLMPYFNRSSMSLHKDYSLHRAYIVFRSLGMRHLTITDGDNGVVGILTRKDLMGFSLEEKIANWRSKSRPANDAATPGGGGEAAAAAAAAVALDSVTMSRAEFSRNYTAIVDIT